MNDIYDHILLQELKKLPRHGAPDPDELGDSFKGEFSGYLDEAALARQLALFESLQATVVKFMKSLSTLEARSMGVQKAFNLTTEQAKWQAYELDKVGQSLGINSRLSKQYAADMAKYLPGQINNINASKSYGREMAATNDVLRNQLGLNAKQAYSVRKLASLQNKSVTEYIIDANKKAILIKEETGYAGALVDILTEVGNLNGDLAAQYGNKGITGDLEKAVIMAKKFGTTLDQLHKTGKGMLDIQSTTTSMVEYQVVSGKKLEGQIYKNVAAEYNQATLNGDAEKQLDIILDVLDTQGDTLDTNMLAREAAAKLLHMEVGAMMDMRQQQKELNKLKADEKTLSKAAGESDEDFEKRKEKHAKDIKKQADKLLALESQLSEIGAENSILNSVQKFDNEQEQVKTDAVLEQQKKSLAKIDPATGKPTNQLGITQDRLVEGGKSMMKAGADIMDSTTGKIILKGATVYADLKFAKESIDGLTNALIDKTGTYDTENSAADITKAPVSGEDVLLRPGKPDIFLNEDDIKIFGTNLFDESPTATSVASGGNGAPNGDMSAIAMAISKLAGKSNGTTGPEIANAIAGIKFNVTHTIDAAGLHTLVTGYSERTMNSTT